MAVAVNWSFWLASATPLIAVVAAFYLSRTLSLRWRIAVIFAVLALSLPAGFALVVAAVGEEYGLLTPFLLVLFWCLAAFGSAVTLIGAAFDAAKRKTAVGES